jgi:hypothetical protein
MNRDGKNLDSLTARELAVANIFGGYFKNREDTLKNWTENACEIKSVDVADAGSASVTADTSILIHKGTANGTCFGQPVGPVLGTSILRKGRLRVEGGIHDEYARLLIWILDFGLLGSRWG